MQKQIKSVELFHQTFKSPVATIPTLIPEDRSNLRFDLMKEENEEYQEAVKNGDLVEIADALGDMAYILCGTIIEHGLQDKIEAVFDEIQRSNMSKADSNGQPIFREDGKILKGVNYSKPDILAVLMHKETITDEEFAKIKLVDFHDKGVSFGKAIELMEAGLKLQRAGWNGKGMYLYYVPANEYPAITEVAKKEFPDGLVPYGAYIAMKTAQGNVVPWLASQTDMLAKDWKVYE